MKRFFKWIILILIIALAGTGLAFYRSWLSKKDIDSTNIPLTTVKKGTFVVSIREVGKLDARKSVYVNSNTQGKIVKLVPEGTPVKKDEPIVWLDTTDLEKNIKDGENNLKDVEQTAKKDEEQLRLQKYQNDQTVAGARLALENAQLDYTDSTTKLAKTQRLFDAQVIPESNLEDAKLRVLSADAGVEKANLSLAQAEENRKSNLVSAQISLSQSKANVEESRRKLNEFKDQLKDAIIKAPGDGIIVYELVWRSGDRTRIQEGDQVWQRMAIAQLPDLSKMITKVMIDEIDISRVRIGQEVLVKVDAIPDIELKGTISQIATLAVDKGAGDAPFWMRREASGVKAFDVTAEIDPNQYDLRPGMTTKTEIVLEKFLNAIYVPREAVFDDNIQKVVYLNNNGTVQKQVVKTGKGDANFVIIESGLKGGEKILLRDPTKQIKESKTEVKGKKGTAPEKPTPAMPALPSNR